MKKARRPKPPGRSCASKRRVFVSFAVLARRVSETRTIEELNVVGDDLIAVALDALIVGPLRIVEPALDRNQHALACVLGDHPAKPGKAGHPVPLGILGGKAARILVGLALAVAFGPTGAEAEGGDVRAAIGSAALGIGAKIADEDHDVGHVKVSLRLPPGPPR